MPIACEQIRNEFSALLDDELNSEDRELVEEHLSECAECLRELHGYKQVSDSYFYHHPVKAPDDFDELLREALAPASSSTGMGWSPWRMAAAAVIVFTVGAIGWRAMLDGPGDTIILSSNFNQNESVSDSAEEPTQGATEAALEQASAAASNDLVEAELAAPTAALGGRSAGATPPEFGREDTPLEAREAQGLMKQSAPAADAPNSLPAEAPARSRKMEKSDGVSIQAATPASPPAEGFSIAAAPAPAPAPMLEESVAEAKNDSANAPRAESEAMADADDAPSDEPQRALLKRRMQDETDIPSIVQSPSRMQWREQRFSLIDDVLTQSDYSQETLVEVPVPSEAWTKLLDAHPDLTQLVDASHAVIVRLDETWYRITIAAQRPAVAPSE